MENEKRRFTPEQKVELLKAHFLNKKPVSEICEAHQIHVNQFYKWQSEFFANGHRAFEKSPGGSAKAEKTIANLHEKISRQNGIISEIMTEFIDCKKNLG